MGTESELLETERQFFSSLVAGDVHTLDRLLAEDFTIIDVMRGSEVAKPALLEAIRSGQMKFESVVPIESRVRFYPPTAIVTGRTRMTLRARTDAFTVASRYTHVYVEQRGQWRLVAAQGTQILE
jgi:ketosteroid isomerase-like protein